MKKVLFISYYWPPAGGPPINRIFNFYKYLPEFGWEPVILTVGTGTFPFFDPSLLKYVRPETKIYTSKNIRIPFSTGQSKVSVPYGFTDASNKSFKNKILRFVKYNLIPDPRIIWLPFALKKAVEIIKKEDIQLIFSSSPPQTNHIIASIASRRTNRPWVGDLRDPWSDVFWLKEQKLRLGCIHALDKKIELNTLQRMTEIVSVSPSLVTLLGAKAKRPVHLVYNGFDPNLYKNADAASGNGGFNILYAGSISSDQRPETFFDALNLIKENHPEIFQEIEVEFLGSFPEFLYTIIAEKGLADKVKFTNFLPMEEAVGKMQSAALLLLINQRVDGEMGLSSKIFDYLGSRRPVIAFGQVKSHADLLLQDTGAGKLFNHGDVENAYRFILDVFHKKFMIGEENKAKISKYNRKDQTRHLAQIFDKAINKHQNEK